MESLGKILKEARLKANVSIGQISRETKITKKYLEALENEEYSIFPGETYLKGFLKSYCDFLNLNSKEMMNIYEKIKIAESPTPIDKLIPKPKLNLRPIITIFIMIIIACGIITGGILLSVKLVQDMRNKNIASNISVNDKKKKKIGPNVYKLKDTDQEKIFDLKKGDIIEYTTDSHKYNIMIKELSPIVVVDDPNGDEIFLIKSYRRKLDLNNDEIFDVVLNLNNWDSEIANISFSPYKEEMILSSELGELKPLKGDNPETIVRKNKLEKISFSLNFKNSSFLRYKIDEQEEIEKFYNNQANQSIIADKRVIVWLSNAGIVTLNFNDYNKSYTPGYIGQVAVKLIQWIALDNGEYELQISSLQ